MRALVQQLQSRFDLDLFASGPLGVETDVCWLAEVADCVLLVTRWRATPDTAVSAALERLRNDHARAPGVVLNQVNLRRQIHYTADDASVYQRQSSK